MVKFKAAVAVTFCHAAVIVGVACRSLQKERVVSWSTWEACECLCAHRDVRSLAGSRCPSGP